MPSFANAVLSSRPGETCVFSTGQAGYILKSASGQLLAIDLYLSECVERLEGHPGFKRLLPQILNPSDIEFDVVVCTHEHLDHFDIDAVPQMLANKKTKLFCSVDCDQLVEQTNLSYCANQITYVKPGGSATVGDFHLEFVNCDHGTGAPDAVGVVVEVDGKRVYEAGDTCLRLDRVDEIAGFGQLDALIAPINGAYGNLNENECAQLAAALQPKVTIPCHYGMFASHHGDVGKFYEAMGDQGLPSLIMRQGERYVL